MHVILTSTALSVTQSHHFGHHKYNYRYILRLFQNVGASPMPPDLYNRHIELFPITKQWELMNIHMPGELCQSKRVWLKCQGFKSAMLMGTHTATVCDLSYGIRAWAWVVSFGQTGAEDVLQLQHDFQRLSSDFSNKIIHLASTVLLKNHI